MTSTTMMMTMMFMMIGVNDNGAAVVVMLQAARELSRQLTRNSTVMFFAFDLEEWEQSTLVS